MATAPQRGERKDIIVVNRLSKTYPNGTKAVRDVSFTVKEGEIFGLLGPNGAGKSTTIGMLGTLVRATGGTATVSGINVHDDPGAVRKRIGFAMQEAGVDELATGREFLTLQGRLYGLSKDLARERADKLLRLFEIEDAANRRIGAYSGGMKRRIDLAAAFIHLPQVLFLDEPTEGLDPRSRRKLWAALQRLNQKLGCTILLSTHYMEEADYLCDRLAILDQGTIVAMDSPERLKASVGGQRLLLEYTGDDAASHVKTAGRILEQREDVERVILGSHRVTAYVPDASSAAPRILRRLDEADVPPSGLRIHEPTLDDVYLSITGRKLEAEAEAAGQ